MRPLYVHSAPFKSPNWARTERLNISPPWQNIFSGVCSRHFYVRKGVFRNKILCLFRTVCVKLNCSNKKLFLSLSVIWDIRYLLFPTWAVGMPWLNVPQLNVPWTFCPKLNVPWTFRLKWHFVPVTFGPSWDGLYVHSSHHHFCLKNGMLSHNVTFHLFLLRPAQIWWHFVYLIQLIPPYDSSTQVWHDVHPVTYCPSCDTMSSLWHFFLTGTLYLFWNSLSTLNILPILLHFHLCNTWTILWQFVYFRVASQLTHLSRESYGTSLGIGGLDRESMWWSDAWDDEVCSACDNSSLCDMLSTMWHVLHTVTSSSLVTFCPSVHKLSTLWHFVLW